MAVVVSTTDLPPLKGRRGVIPGRHLLEGVRFGLDHLTLVLGETAPGNGIPLHRHDYEEIFIVHAGQGTYTVGETIVEAAAGDIVVVPSGMPHRFVNNAEETLCHTAVHSSGIFELEYLE
jgi:quercetin dioxygenase-like cupin family protein